MPGARPDTPGRALLPSASFDLKQQLLLGKLMGKDEGASRNRRSLSPVLPGSHGSTPLPGEPGPPGQRGCRDARQLPTPATPPLFQTPAAQPQPTCPLRAPSPGAHPCPHPSCHCPPRHWTRKKPARKTSSSFRGAVAPGADPSLSSSPGSSPVVPPPFPSRPTPATAWLGLGSGPGRACRLEALSVGLAMVPG